MISKNKFVLPIIIILLLLTLPLGIYGMITKMNEDHANSNPNHLHYFNGALYYYKANNELIGSYKCLSNDCGDVMTLVDDEYLYRTNGSTNLIGKLNDTMALIYDENIIKLVSVKNNRVLSNYNSAKNYGYDNAAFIILQDTEGKYCAFSPSDNNFALGCAYDYIGYLDSTNTKNIFAVSQDGKYYLVGLPIGGEENRLTPKYNDSIVFYNEFLFVTRRGNTFNLYRYDGTIEKSSLNLFDYYNEFIIVTDNESKLFVYDQYGKIAFEPSDEGHYSYRITENGIEILEDDVVTNTYI